jgi:hypothetical protein
MSGSLIPNAKQQFLDANGNPLAGGFVYYYIPSTTTFKNTYQNAALTILNTNPIILDSAGECIAYGSGTYRQIVTDVNGNLIWDQPTTSLPNDALNVTYLPPFTNAVSETVSAKLSESISVKDFGAKGDGTTNDTTAIQNAINAAITANQALYIPAGTYKVTSSLTINGPLGFKIYGDGTTSIIQATNFTGSVLNISPQSGYPFYDYIIEDIKVQNSAIYSGQYGIGCITGMTGLRMRGVYVAKMDVGFYFHANQFCSNHGIVATQCNVGMNLEADAIGGSGNNNSFYDCWFWGNAVGCILQINGSPYGMANNIFINLVLQTNSVCGFYCNGQLGNTIDNCVPESNGSGASTYTFNGLTTTSVISNSNYQLVNSTLFLRNCLIGGGSPAQSTILSNNSVLNMQDCSTGNFLPVVDSTSMLNFHNTFGGGGSGFNVISGSLPEISSNSAFLSSPMLVETSSLPNDSIAYGGPNVEYGYDSGLGGTASFTNLTDAQMGYVSNYAFSASGQYGGFRVAPDYATIGTQIALSFLVKSSSSSASFVINFGQSTASSTLKIPANTWRRVTIVGTTTAAARGGFVTITGDTSTVGANLSFCKIHAMTNPNASDLGNFVRFGLYNPGIFKARYFKLSAIPTVGTWAVGDLVYNTAPVSGGYVGWVCTTAGTPGTWKTFGLIS